MKAIVITKPGAPEVLQLQERPAPLPNEQEVLIRVKAAGVNRPDVFQRKGNYPPPPGASKDIPGLEVAGIIEQCGAAVTRWKPGDKVCALLTGAGYAQLVAVHAGLCLPIPQGYTFTDAAALPETFFTVWRNVFQRGQLKPGEHFLVHGGSSGIGITAVQLATAFGAKVFATAGSQQKCEACLQAGAYQCINYKTADFETALKSQGIDVILDMIGGDYIPKNLRLLNTDGRLVFINTMKGDTGEFNAMEVMRRRLTITGSTLRPRDTVFKSQLAAELERQVWPMLNSGKIKPLIYREYPLQNAAEAHTLMESSEHIGKIVLTVS